MKRIDYSFARLRSFGAQEITADTASEAKIAKKFAFKKYGLFDATDLANRINTFKCLGYKDPFPNESKFESDWRPPASSDDLVYDHSRLKNDTIPPFLIYLPRKELMFKLMRACISVKHEHQLWFNN